MIKNEKVEYVQCLYLYDVYTKEVLGAIWCGADDVEEGQLVSYPSGIGENSFAIVIREFIDNIDQEDYANAICAYPIEEAEYCELMCVDVETPDYDYHLCSIPKDTNINIGDYVLVDCANKKVKCRVNHIVYIDENMFQEFGFTLYKAIKCEN